MANKRLRPYSTWTPKELRLKLESDINYKLDIPYELKKLWIDIIREAFLSEDWNIIEDYNGCTLVQDQLHPCPACFVHDYMWITGHGGAMADNIFYEMMLAEGMTKAKAKRRWFGVRVGWFAYFRWKYIITRKYQQPTLAMVKLNEYFSR